MPNDYLNLRSYLPASIRDEPIYTDETATAAIENLPFDARMFFRTGKDLCREMKASYTRNSQRSPAFAIIDADAGSAYAIWDGYTNSDWVIVTTNMLKRLFIIAYAVGLDLTRDSIASHIKKTIPTLDPCLNLIKDEQNREYYVLMLMHIALTFIVGHELGHHTNGHQFFYQNKSSAGVIDEEGLAAEDIERREEALNSQSLELVADHIGVDVLRKQLLAKYYRIEKQNYISGNNDQANQTMAAIFADEDTLLYFGSSGLLIAFIGLNPVKWTRETLLAGSHPATAVRAYLMSILLRESLFACPRENQDIWWLAMSSVVTAIGSMLMKAEENTKEITVSDLIKTWEIFGLKRAVHDTETLKMYIPALQERWITQREMCKSFWRVDEALLVKPSGKRTAQ